MKQRAYTVGAAQSAARILRHLGNQEEPVRLSQIADSLQLNPSTCLNILRTLADEGLVQHEPAGKTYSLGMGMVDLARRGLRKGEDLSMIQPMLDRLARMHGVMVSLWRRTGHEHLVLLAFATSDPLMHVNGAVGTRVPLLAGSMGRVVAAWGGLDKAELRRHFGKVEWYGSLDFDTFMTQVEEARLNGWTSDHGIYDGKRSGLSAPIPGWVPVQRILNAAIFTDRYSEALIRSVAQDLVDTAASIASGTSG